jgi:hypothetical protein
MRKLAFALVIGLLASLGALGTAVQPVNAMGAEAKVVIVVGATQSTTDSYRSHGDEAAATFARYTSNIVKVYSPNATWAAVQAAARGASVLVYLGHGSGFPNPYNSARVSGDDGMGLNATAGNGDGNTKFYGESYMAQLGLAANAVVLLSHLCYASGNSEPGNGTPTFEVAQARVDNYAAGFLQGNARAVIAEGTGSLSPYIDDLFSSGLTVDQIWKTYPGFHGNVASWASTRNPGYVSQIDSNGTSYYRSMVSLQGLTVADESQVLFDVTGYFTPDTSGSTYVPLAPARILDSRDGTGSLGIFRSHIAQTFGVTGQGGVPSNATAVTGNLTVTQQTSLGYLSIGPVAMNNPTSSTLNFPTNDDRANGVTVALGTGGTLSVTYAAPTSGPTAQVIFDVTGYFVPNTSGSTFHALTPARILDSRDGTGGLSILSSHIARTFTVVGHGGVPSNATAVTGNLTVTQQSSVGYLSIGPVAQDNPSSSTLNFPVGDDRANAVDVVLGSGGTLSVTYAAPTSGPTAHVIFDVTGYFAQGTSGATFHALSPARILDTRDGTGLSDVFTTHVARPFGVSGHGGVPSNANAVTGNLTVTQQSSLGYLYIGPVAMNNPTSSTLNFPVRDDRANGVTVALGSGGTLSVTFAAP